MNNDIRNYPLVPGRGHPLENFHAFIGFGELQEDETRYLPADELRRRYDGSIGFKS